MLTLKEFTSLPLRYHLMVGCIIRLGLILYAEYHDQVYDVPYTDVDYKVFTDAARYVVNSDSPFKRHTYRYSPIIAFIMVPNVVLYKNFGKIVFSLFDILITIAVKRIVKGNLKIAKPQSTDASLDSIATYSSLFWLYNPLSIAISTRGNADSVPCFLIILSVYFLQTNSVSGLAKYAFSGMLLGIAIHLRLYPVAFSFPMYLSLGSYRINSKTSFAEAFKALLPNSKQIVLAASCVAALFSTTYLMYAIYGYEFLFETYIYHLFRKDTKHNFSILFYYSYLSAGQLKFDFIKSLVQILQCVILFVISLSFGSDAGTLSFGLFAQSVIMVAYNGVVTSQYFVWFLSLLPLVVHDLKITSFKAAILALIWGAAQGAWLFYAYLLEFKSREVFILIWLKGIVFFCTNVYVLCRLIRSYSPGFGFGFQDWDFTGKCKTN